MKQTAVIKKLRIVQAPITQCLYTVPDVANLSFRAYVPIEEQMKALGDRTDLSSAELASDGIPDDAEGVEETKKIDPLLALAGTLKRNDISGPDTPLPLEIRVVKGAHEDNPDPLLALAGTLQSDVSDVSEHHDDYIAAVLLAELRGDEDE